MPEKHEQIFFEAFLTNSIYLPANELQIYHS